MLERRGFLTALVGAPVVAAGHRVTADPVVTLFNERLALHACINGPAALEVVKDAAWDRRVAVNLDVIGRRAATVEGARASLEWALDELRTFYCRDEGCIGDRLVLSLIEGALGVLRQLGGAA